MRQKGRVGVVGALCLYLSPGKEMEGIRKRRVSVLVCRGPQTWDLLVACSLDSRRHPNGASRHLS